jgi:hypothetical protein
VNIGIVAYTGSAREGNTGCEVTVWHSATSITCQVVRGTSGTHSVSMTVGEMGGSLSEAYSVDVASGLIAARGTNQQVKASAPLLIIGAGLGVTMFTDKARVGDTECEATAWTSVSSLACGIAPSVPGSQMVRVTMGQSVESLYNAFTVDAVAILSVEGLLPYEEHITLTAATDLLLRAFTMQAKLGSSCCSTTIWQSQSSLTCRTSSAVGKSKSFVVTAGQKLGSVTQAVSMQSAVVRISLSNSAPSATSVTVHGNAFGLCSNSVASSIGNTAHERSVWTSETSIFSNVASGSGTSYRLMITAGVQASSATEIISYDGPRLLSVSNYGVHPQDILMVGADLSGIDTTLAARVGQTAVHTTRWTSDSAITCSIEKRFGASMSVSVTAGATHGSRTESFSFESTTLRAIGNSAVAGKSTLTLSGDSFSKHRAYSPSMRLGFSVCEAAMWSSTTSVKCMSAQGHRSSHRVVVTTGMIAASSTSIISYSSPTVLDISSANVGWLVPHAVVAFGSNLGQSMALSAGQSQSEFSSWISETAVVSMCARGTGSSHSLVLTTGMLLGSISDIWSIDAGQVSAVAQTNSVSHGKTFVQMAGTANLWDASSRARLGSTQCESSSWYSSSSILCTAPAGIGLALILSVTTDSQVYTISASATYDASSLTAGGPTNAPTASQHTLTLTGSNMMSWSLSPKVKIGHTASPASIWTSFSSILGMTPPGGLTSPHYAIVISIAQNQDTRSGAFTYDVPAISGAEVSQTKDQATPAILDLLGINFGATDHSMTAAIGIISCTTSQWVSDSAISCTIPISFDESAFANSARDGRGKICKRCSAGFTVACSSSDPGYCIDCITCGAGFQTINCNAITERR